MKEYIIHYHSLAMNDIDELSIYINDICHAPLAARSYINSQESIRSYTPLVVTIR